MKYVEKIGAAVAAWWAHPAQPWEFWWPQSGLAGGFFLGCVLSGAVAWLT